MVSLLAPPACRCICKHTPHVTRCVACAQGCILGQYPCALPTPPFHLLVLQTLLKVDKHPNGTIITERLLSVGYVPLTPPQQGSPDGSFLWVDPF